MLHSIPDQRQCNFPRSGWGNPLGKAWNLHPEFLSRSKVFGGSVFGHCSDAFGFSFIDVNQGGKIDSILYFCFRGFISARFLLESLHRISTRWSATARCERFESLYSTEVCSRQGCPCICAAAFGFASIQLFGSVFFAFFYFPWPVSKDSVGSQHAPACSRYHETMNLVPNDSEYAEAELKHPNIFVMRHRSRFNSNLLWTHHEKLALSSSVSGWWWFVY